MNKICLFLFSSLISSAQVIYDFNKNSNNSDWWVVDDVVMGGESQGNFTINNFGNGVFYGNISLENNGGFSSIRYRFQDIDVSKFSKIVLKVKGDNKVYQFRIKDNTRNYHSYKYEFTASNYWKEIEINLQDFYPVFRGRRLKMPNFSLNKIQEISFLIANKKNENFRLVLDKIYLK